MLKSMTGYGRSKLQFDGKEYIIEIKSVNHRYVDINVKTPRNISYIEDKIKKMVLNSVSRGKIDVYINCTNIGNSSEKVYINKNLAGEYIKQLQEIALENNLNTNINITDIINFPDILVTNNFIDEETLWNEFEPKICEALEQFDNMKIEEGKKLCTDVLSRIDIIDKNLLIISHESTGLVEKYIVKLEARIKEILKDNSIIDQNRLAQEAVIFSDKSSIEEEITRLNSHINQFKQMINESSAKGKQIDFLVQEMNREINTIASKANCLEITKMVIAIKTELENIREQIQNIE